jgi:hypothetical protein
MLGKRKETEKYILDLIASITQNHNGPTVKLYKKKFSRMTDDAFHAMMEGIRDGKVRLKIIVPNFGEKLTGEKISMENNLAVAQKYGHDFFQQVWIPEKDGNREYLTPKKYLVMDEPLIRQAQLLEKKISIPEDNLVVDDMTGQPAGRSAAAKISYMETQVVASMGLDSCLEELIKARGGDEGMFSAMNTSIHRTGGVNLDTIRPYSTGVGSGKALKAFLLGMQLKSTL